MVYTNQPDFVFVAAQPQTREQTVFDNILRDIVAEGGYEAALLADSDGFALAAMPFDTMTELMAAVTAMLRDTVNQAHQHLKLDNINELSLVSDNRLRFICRFFQTDVGQSLSLTVIAPADQAYRRITNQAVNRIKEACINSAFG